MREKPNVIMKLMIAVTGEANAGKTTAIKKAVDKLGLDDFRSLGRNNRSEL